MIVEIGTCDFDTMAGKKPGLFVEPIKEHFDRLPNNCLKENVAISNYEGTVDVFYVPSDVILKNNLPQWVRGCNSIGKIHPTIEKNGWGHMVITQQVSVTKLATLLSKHNIKNIDYLKVDTEGHDCVILNNFLDESLIRPMAIKFESNILQDKNDVQNLVSRLQKIGYSITYDCDNVIAILISL